MEAGLSRKAQESGRMGDIEEEDVEGIKWNAEAPSSTSASKVAHISLGKFTCVQEDGGMGTRFRSSYTCMKLTFRWQIIG